MSELFSELKMLFPVEIWKHGNQIFYGDIFRIQKYHDKFEVYFHNKFFGEIDADSVVALLKLYKDGNKEWTKN